MNKKVFLALIASFITVHAASGQQLVDYRLPAGIKPVSQSIELRIDPEQPDYSGHVVIHLNIGATVERIGIHQVGLDMASITLSSGPKSRDLEATVGGYDINWLADGKSISPGDYELSIAFSGKHSTDSLGMHRVTFEGNGYVFTQFEAMRARRAMPIFDEPAFKIPFQMTIVAPGGHTVISNTPVASRRLDNGWQRVEFMPTKPLPSYLIAYAVGPLDRAPLEGMSVPGFVYMPKGHADTVGFVQLATPKIVAALEDYFDIDYPYRKLDFVAVPEFAFGAMENPGLMTYRTDLLMIGDNSEGSAAERSLSVIAHEVAHIWFGDLVTMEWWDDLWLNEAFATWMAKMTLGRVYPQYESNLKLSQTSAFASDQRTTTTAIRRTITSADEIFGDIGLNYSKGSTILGMLENYVGYETWRRGIRAYVKKHAWGSTTEADLWAAISDASGLDVANIATAYLNQPGFAIVNIDRSGNVAQQRYLTYGREAEEFEWRIPLNIKYRNDAQVRETFYLLQAKTGRIDVPQDANWIMPDAGGHGYYRWQIDPQQFYALVDDAPQLTNREKIAMLDNSEALLSAGRISLADYLYVIDALLTDLHPLVFRPALEKLKKIGDDFVNPSNAELFARFVDDKLAARFVEIGTETRNGDSETLIQMRPRLLRVLGEFGADSMAREAAVELTDRYLASSDSVGSDLGREALRVTALADDGRRYEQFIEAYLESESEVQKSDILSSIYFDDSRVIPKHLDFSITAAVPAGDAIKGIGLYGYAIDDHAELYKWLGNNLDAFEAKIPAVRHSLLPQLMVGKCNEKNLAYMKEFFADRGDKYAASLAKSVEHLETCIGRKQRESEALMEFLAQYAD